MERTYIEEAVRRTGETVTLAGWVSRIRDKGKIRFIVLRDITGDLQVTVKPGNAVHRKMDSLSLGREDVISVKGRAVTSQIAHAGVEFIPEDIEVLNRSKQPLPFVVSGEVKAELDTRLNYRFMDFRTQRTSAIFKIQHELLTAFRRFLTDRGYLEIQPPCIIASASEGGADLFKLPYFEKEAYLAQSPQLYKQMCAISFEKVFTVVPIWRAEKFKTPTHLNEVRQMDIERAFANDEDVMSVLEKILVYILREVKINCTNELNILGRNLVIPQLPLKRIKYTDAIKILQNVGEKILWGDDFSKSQEQKLWELVDEEAFLVKDWPAIQKPFYAMPYDANDIKDAEYLLSNYTSIEKFSLNIVRAFDLIYSGIEISSGTQRVHLPQLLREQLNRKGLNPIDFKYYVDSFAYGTPPHAGWSIGLERLTMTVTGMKNIRECCMFPRDRDRLVP